MHTYQWPWLRSLGRLPPMRPPLFEARSRGVSNNNKTWKLGSQTGTCWEIVGHNDRRNLLGRIARALVKSRCRNAREPTKKGIEDMKSF